MADQTPNEAGSPPKFDISWQKVFVSIGSIFASFVAVLVTGYILLIKTMYGDLDTRVQANSSQIEQNLKMQGRFEAFFQDTLPKFILAIDKSVNENQELGLKIAKSSLRMDDLTSKIDELKSGIIEANKTNKEILIANLGLKSQLDELASDIRFLKSKIPVRKGALGEMVVGAAKATGAFDENKNGSALLAIAQLGGPMMSSQAFGLVGGTDDLKVLAYAGSTDLYKLYSLFLPKQRGIFPIAKHRSSTKIMLAFRRKEHIAGYFDH